MYRTPIYRFLAGPNLAPTISALDPFMAQLIYEAQQFVLACWLETASNAARGGHWYQISGHDRNNKSVGLSVRSLPQVLTPV